MEGFLSHDVQEHRKIYSAKESSSQHQPEQWGQDREITDLEAESATSSRNAGK